MKIGVVVCGPDMEHGAFSLLSGTFEEKVAKAAELGCDGIELMVRDPSDGFDLPAVKATLDQAGLEVPQVATGALFGVDSLCLVTADEDLRRRAEQRTQSLIDVAANFGAMINIGRLRGRLEWLGDVSDPWKIAVERLRQLAKYAADRGVRISMEPINRYETDFIFNATDGMRLVNELDCDNFGLMLDTFHMNIEDDSIEEGLRLTGDRLWHVHVADSNRRYPGSGHLDFPAILSVLEDMGYEGYISAELLPLPDPDTAARKTIEFLRKCM